MENASKALLIAGGVLIAMLMVGLLVYSFGSISGYFKEEETKEQVEQLAAFNNQYEAYNRKLLRGTDVVSIVNKVLDNNKRYEDEQEYQMSMEFEMVEAMSYKKVKDEDGKVVVVGTTDAVFDINKRYNQNNFLNIKNNSEAFTDFKRRVFDCVEVNYSKTTGRVNYLRFKERKLDNYEEGL